MRTLARPEYRRLALTWLATRILLMLWATTVLPWFSHGSVVGDVAIYRGWAKVLETGTYPVHDTQWQYPPAAALVFLIGRHCDAGKLETMKSREQIDFPILAAVADRAADCVGFQICTQVGNVQHLVEMNRRNDEAFMIFGNHQSLCCDLEQGLAQWTGTDFVPLAQFLELQPFARGKLMADDIAA